MSSQTYKDFEFDYLNGWFLKNYTYETNNHLIANEYFTDNARKKLKEITERNKKNKIFIESTSLNHNPDILFLSSEPFPFKIKHIEQFKQLLPTTKILIVDGEYFSWYGSRLVDSPAYFSSIHRQLISN